MADRVCVSHLVHSQQSTHRIFQSIYQYLKTMDFEMLQRAVVQSARSEHSNFNSRQSSPSSPCQEAYTPCHFNKKICKLPQHKSRSRFSCQHQSSFFMRQIALEIWDWPVTNLTNRLCFSFVTMKVDCKFQLLICHFPAYHSLLRGKKKQSRGRKRARVRSRLFPFKGIAAWKCFCLSYKTLKGTNTTIKLSQLINFFLACWTFWFKGFWFKGIVLYF